MPEYITKVVTSSGVPLKELVGAEVQKITRSLRGTGSCDFISSMWAPGIEVIDGYANEIQVFEDGQPIPDFWGIVLREDGDSTKVTFQCEGLAAHLYRRFVDRTTLLYSSIEQRAIGWSLLAYAQDESVQGHRDLNIDSAIFSGTTHLRTRRYLRDEHANILDLLNEFPEVTDGFEWGIIHDATARLWTPFYPQRGAVKNNIVVEWEPGEDTGLTGLKYKRDWTRLTTQAYVTGGNDTNNNKIEANYEDAARSAIYGVCQRVVSDGSQTDPSWLLARATKEVTTFGQPVVLPTISLPRAGARDYWRAMDVGDTVWVDIVLPRYTVRSQQRVVEMTLNVQTQIVDTKFAESL